MNFSTQHEPILISPPQPRQPTGHWLTRGLVAVFCERRLPTQVAAALDRWLIRCGWPTKTIRVGTLRFRVRRLTADEHFVREVVIEREYSREGFEINDADCVVDIGGNIGSFAVLAGSQARRGRVISCEPIAANFRLLEENLRRNGLKNVTAIRAAMVERSGPVEIFVSDEGSGSHSVVRELAGASRRREPVGGYSLADLFAKFAIERCDLLKLDCEGAEFPILHSLPPELARRIRRVVLEYHAASPEDKRSEAGGLIARLESLGFLIEHYTDVAGTNRGMIFARRSG